MVKSRFVVVAFVSLMLASLYAQAVPLSDGETAEPGASDYEITGTVFFGEGEYSGKITGEGTAVIETGGNTAVCVFSNGENSYSGGTIISNAAWRVTENGATGTGKITIGLQASYFLIAGNATVIANEIEVMQSSNTSYQKGSIQMPLWHEVEFTGGIRAHGALAVMPTRKDKTYEGGMTVYNCDVRCFEGASKMNFNPYGYGTNIFRKAIACSIVHLGENASEVGWYEFHSGSNDIAQLRVRCGKIGIFADNVTTNGGIYFRYAGDVVGRSVVTLNGHDQSFDYIADVNIQASGYLNGRKCLTSEEPACVTLTGRGLSASSSYYTSMANAEWKLEGAVSFCLDAKPFKNFAIGFSKATHTTTGDLVISNGTLNINNGATMPNVGRVVVAEGGCLAVNAGLTGAFVGCRRLAVDGSVTFTDDSALAFSQNALDVELGTNAQLRLPEGCVLTVNSLTTGGVAVVKGQYDVQSIPQIVGGTLNVVPPVVETEATWTGGGVDDAVTTAANWSTNPELPPFDTGSVLAKFAAGGTQAVLDGDIALRGIVFGLAGSGVPSFALVGEGRTISVKGEGVTVDAAGEGEHVWSIGPQVAYTESVDQTLEIPEGHVLDFAGGVSQPAAFVNAKTGAGTLKVGGSNGFVNGSYRILEGSAEFFGTAQVESGVYVSNAALRVAGRIVSTDKSDLGTGTGLPNHGVMVDARKTADGQGALSSVVFDGATLDAPLRICGPGSGIPYPARTNWLQFAAGSTNAFNEYVRLQAPLGDAIFGPDSQTTFNSRLYIGGEFSFKNSDPMHPATVNFASENRTFDSSSGGGPRVYGGLVVNLSGTNNLLRAGTTKRDYYALALVEGPTTVNFLNDDFFLCGGVRSSGGSVRIDLGGTRQRLWEGTFDYSSSRLTGTEGSELEIGGDGGHFSNNYRVEGAVSLRMRSQTSDYDGTLTQDGTFVNNVAVASTGNVTVDSGTLRFSATGSWTNAGVVTVNGGRLELANAAAFGRDAKVVMTGGRISFEYDGAGRPLRVGELWIGPDAEHLVRMPAGVYSASEAPSEAGIDPSQYFEGEGRMLVRGGLVLIVR